MLTWVLSAGALAGSGRATNVSVAKSSITRMTSALVALVSASVQCDCCCRKARTGVTGRGGKQVEVSKVKVGNGSGKRENQ